MNVLYLTPGCFDKGGISRYARYQVTALREIAGPSNVAVYSLLGPDADSFESHFDTEWYAGGNTWRAKTELALRAALRALRSRPDVVIAGHVNLSGLALLTARAVGAKLVLNVYGLEVWSGLRRDASFGLTGAHHVISDCHFTAGYLEDQGLRRAGTTRVIWDCVDLGRFKPGRPSDEVLARYGIPTRERSINLLTLGRLSKVSKYKGYERLLEIFARLAKSIPTLTLIFAGRGDLIPILREQAVRRGVLHRVVFTGSVREDDLPDVYRSAHIFSLVTERGVGRGEGIPLTPLEAAASGVPVIVGNQDGSREAIVDGESGRILNPADLAEHEQVIRTLATDPSIRDTMARAARQRMESHFAYPSFREKHRDALKAWLPDRFS
jgi:phosphatidylinositol alpha-1,6-mannosyltransferase